MGLFDKFKKINSKNSKNPDVEDNQEVEKMQTHGWDAISSAFNKIYPGQENPKHYGTLIKWKFGGNDPLDGISVYDGGDYWHFVTYGLSDIYEKETDDPLVSGYGMEFTLKLKKDDYSNEEGEIRCICGILQQIARITFTSGEIFNEYEYLYTGQTVGIDLEQKSNITGFITIPDTNIVNIDTPNGKVKFIEFIGVTDIELLSLRNQEVSVKELYNKLGSDITDYDRKSYM